MTGTFQVNRCSMLGVFLLAALGIVPVARGATAVLSATRDASITGATVDQYLPSSYGLPVNVFNNTQSVIDFALSSIPANATINSIAFNFDETSYANMNGLVSINGYGRNGTIVPADATASATQFGSYNSVALGLGQHSIALNSAADMELQSLLGGSNDLGLRLTGISNDTNTGIGSIEQSPSFSAPSLLVNYSVAPEPTSTALLFGLTGLAVLVSRRTRSGTDTSAPASARIGC